MFAAISPSDADRPASARPAPAAHDPAAGAPVAFVGDRAAAVPAARRWADGAAEVTMGLRDGETCLRHLYQSDPCRVLFPRVPAGSPPEVVIVTTSGGIVGGDRLRVALKAQDGSSAAMTTQAAEKVYRSTGAVSEISVEAAVGNGAFLEWMPQETILFDGARLRRTNSATLDGTARLLTGEIVVFGRRARGETFTGGMLHDAWRLRRDGRLVWADALRLDGPTGATFADPFALDGAAAVATMIYAGADAAAQGALMRGILADGPDDGVRCAATCIGDIALARFLGPDAAALRARFAGLWTAVRHAAAGYPARLPRVWAV